MTDTIDLSKRPDDGRIQLLIASEHKDALAFLYYFVIMDEQGRTLMQISTDDSTPSEIIDGITHEQIEYAMRLIGKSYMDLAQRERSYWLAGPGDGSPECLERYGEGIRVNLKIDDDETRHYTVDNFPERTTFSASVLAQAQPHLLETRITIRAENGAATYRVMPSGEGWSYLHAERVKD